MALAARQEKGHGQSSTGPTTQKTQKRVETLRWRQTTGPAGVCGAALKSRQVACPPGLAPCEFEEPFPGTRISTSFRRPTIAFGMVVDNQTPPWVFHSEDVIPDRRTSTTTMKFGRGLALT